MLSWHPFINYQEYLKYDKQLKDACCGVAGLCHMYYERRPSQDCTGYTPPARCKHLYLIQNPLAHN